MDKFILEGKQPLQGEVAVSGAKNAVLPVLAACLLSKGTCVIKNVPVLDDVLVMCQVLQGFGADVTFEGNCVVVKAGDISPVAVNPMIIRKMRASNLVLGPILARFKEAEIAYPGGCSIGARPMDLHLRALREMGGRIFEEEDRIYAFTKGLLGTELHLDFPSVGATENIIMAAALAKGDTVIHNAAREPEIQDLAGFINCMGGKVSGAGTDTVVISGVKKLGSAAFSIMPDRIECGTLLTAAAITGGQVFLHGANANHNLALFDVLSKTGAELYQNNTGVGLVMKRKGGFKGQQLETVPYPGFPTDMQPQIMALLALGGGTSTITETLFENRFRHVKELRKMGADITVNGHQAMIHGVEALHGAEVAATDLRAGAALVIAALAAEGNSVIHNVHYIDRGYEHLEDKLEALGVTVKRVSEGMPKTQVETAYPQPGKGEYMAMEALAKKIFQDNSRKFVLL